ncbi:MAG: sigma-70 family RNA polymerase sigma factor [Candidatus Cybelea sp.]
MLLLYLRPGAPHVSQDDPAAAARAAKQSPSHARTTGVSALLAEAPRIRMKAAPEDGDLVAMTLQGNSEAFATLVERYDRAVYHLSYRMLHNVEDARDATQEAFFKAFRSLRTFRACAKFSTWIFAISYHACCDRLARRKHDASDELPDRADPAQGPEQQAIALDEASRLRQAIDALPEKYRAVVTLFHLQGRQYEEIASVLGLPLGTVKTHLFRAKEQLRRLLDGMEVTES